MLNGSSAIQSIYGITNRNPDKPERVATPVKRRQKRFNRAGKGPKTQRIAFKCDST